ncbi:enoyl-CoA hydratase/isomerase family protein [Blastochloris viridis]|uniref:3-hydroxyisobutyryl-CoA hydrolase n=1 Tax=Blastochloris viridis TaxID=1079 RepID=A0A0H5B7D9_BLAVI|nr:enoyl-CoA hydratase/isomerase family protein [Blastochloris viridis]ALK08621.1 2,3-dehydroadipyl-CoA hydratase [Blastochloris viridis]BAR98087.1 3-hydroxyisobutyryl-CoA hydrolase [Blastochloris viridis]CUU41284.1 putative enoyl-CoA hydratase echA8 [Blastochloris viridis]
MDCEILFEQRGAAGIVTLNRPKALNALTHAMALALSRQLDAWAEDRTVSCVVVKAAGERAFSAGGDVRKLYDLGRAEKFDEQRAFWHDEYLLNAKIKAYPKPYVALVDGIVMGGGVGISIHGSHCIAGDRFLFAMPEVGIGLFPDVGATYALPRLPDAVGSYLALTGTRIGRADAAAVGLVRAAVWSDDFPALIDDLASGEDADAVVAGWTMAPEPAPLDELRPLIRAWFAGDSVEDILARLDLAGAPGPELAAAIRTKSPTSLKIAFAQMQRGGALSFAEAMRTEYRIVTRVARGHDFYEGVRALIVDKDNAPRWSPATLDAVPPADIERHFAPLDDELPL